MTDPRLATDPVFTAKVQALAATFPTALEAIMAFMTTAQAEGAARGAADAKAAQAGTADAALLAERKRAADIVEAAVAVRGKFEAELQALKAAQFAAYEVYDLTKTALQVVLARPVQATERLA